jgi:hypothetical protein
VTARVEGGRPVRPAPSFPPSPHRFMRRALLLTALLCLLAPASSLASTASEGNRVIRDCSSDGEINGKYSQAAYDYARKHLPSDLAEYTNCADAIRQAQAAAAAGHGGGGGGGGGGSGTGGGSTGGAIGGGFDVPATPYTASVSPSERSAIQGAQGAGNAVSIGAGAPVTPGGPGITASSVSRALPAPLLTLLVLLGLGAAGGASVAIRTRVLSRRQA